MKTDCRRHSLRSTLYVLHAVQVSFDAASKSIMTLGGFTPKGGGGGSLVGGGGGGCVRGGGGSGGGGWVGGGGAACRWPTFAELVVPPRVTFTIADAVVVVTQPLGV